MTSGIRQPYAEVADLDARVRSLDHLVQLAALAAGGGEAAADAGDVSVRLMQTMQAHTQLPRARKGASRPGARPGFERLAQRAAALTVWSMQSIPATRDWRDNQTSSCCRPVWSM